MRPGPPTPLPSPASAVLRMATINGARSVLWEDEIGSLEEGKKGKWQTLRNQFSLCPLQDGILYESKSSPLRALGG